MNRKDVCGRSLEAIFWWLEQREWIWTVSRYQADNGVRGCRSSVWDRERISRSGAELWWHGTGARLTPRESLQKAMESAGVVFEEESVWI